MESFRRVLISCLFLFISSYSMADVIAGRYLHLCAIDKKGVQCWGSNGESQTKVPSLSNPKMVARFKCMVKSTDGKKAGYVISANTEDIVISTKGGPQENVLGKYMAGLIEFGTYFRVWRSIWYFNDQVNKWVIWGYNGIAYVKENGKIISNSGHLLAFLDKQTGNFYRSNRTDLPSLIGKIKANPGDKCNLHNWRTLLSSAGAGFLLLMGLK